MNRLTLSFLSAIGMILSIVAGCMLGELVKGETNTAYILATGACLFFGGLFSGLSIRD